MMRSYRLLERIDIRIQKIVRIFLVASCYTRTLRFSSLTTLLIPHRAIQDSSIGGHPVPKDSPVMFNLWNMHRDEKYWDKPLEFRPERWIQDNKFVLQASFLPFGAGRRSCLGETMAKLELFVILARLLKDFKIESATCDALPTLEGKLGCTLAPVPYNCKFIPR